MKRFILVVTIFLMVSTLSNAQKTTAEPLVLIKTSYGNITLKLYNDTPKHRDNFLKLVKEGWYKDSPFHRIINGFMIQGGGNADGRTDPGYTIEAEIMANHMHKRGALAAARTGDNVNPERRSSGCQFYIVQGSVYTNDNLNSFEQRYGTEFTPEQRKAYTTVGGAPHLDGAYTIFGEVISGMEVVDKIAALPRDGSDKPLKPVLMNVEIME